MVFVAKALKKKGTIAVLFIMTIDVGKVSTEKTPFALIDGYSAIPQEKEMLFSMHTVFNVNDIQNATEEERIWEVHLILTDDNDPELTRLTKRMNEEIQGSTSWYRMAKLMLELWDFSQAEELFNRLLNASTNDSDTANIYYELGMHKLHRGDYNQMINFNKKSLEIRRKTLPEDHDSLVNTYNNIALGYQNLNDYSKTLEYYKIAEKINEKVQPPIFLI